MLCDEVISVVMDIGSLNARCGYSGEDTPRYHSYSKCGVNREDQNQMEQEREKFIYGDESLSVRRDNFEIKDSIRNGYIQNYDIYEGLIKHCYKQIYADPKEYSLMLANNFASKNEREKVSEILFESIQLQNMFTIRNAVLSAFSAGRSTALVLDVGAYQSTAIAVHEGYGMVKTQQTYQIGGETLTQLYLRDLQQNYHINNKPLQYQLTTQSDGSKQVKQFPNTHPSYYEFQLMELIRDIKESTIMISDAISQTNSLTSQYELPDGSKVELQPASINEISESLFCKDLSFISSLKNGSNLQGYSGLHQMIVDSINASNTDLKQALCNTILTTGGSTGIQGWHQSLTNRLSSNLPSMCKVKLVSYPSQTNRQHSVFIGGSILGSLSSFQSMWVTKAEYQEVGYSIIERKCPM